MERAINFNLGVDKDDIENLLEVVPVQWTNEEVLELEQEHKATEEASEKELQKKKNPQENSQ